MESFGKADVLVMIRGPTRSIRPNPAAPQLNRQPGRRARPASRSCLQWLPVAHWRQMPSAAGSA